MGESKIIVFKDDEEGYHSWLQENPHGFVLNTNKYNYSMLHRATCDYIKKYAKNRHTFTSNGVFKVCSSDISPLKDWLL